MCNLLAFDCRYHRHCHELCLYLKVMCLRMNYYSNWLIFQTITVAETKNEKKQMRATRAKNELRQTRKK